MRSLREVFRRCGSTRSVRAGICVWSVLDNLTVRGASHSLPAFDVRFGCRPTPYID
jgi:hypothetical protein